MIHDCEDILIDLADDGIKYHVTGDEVLVIDISDNVKKIELKKYEENFERLFDYLDSLGYKLLPTSFYEGDGWEYHERCPNCNSSRGITGNRDILKCSDCGYKDDPSEFTVSEHPLTKGELMWSVKSGDKPDHIYLEFNK